MLITSLTLAERGFRNPNSADARGGRLHHQSWSNPTQIWPNPEFGRAHPEVGQKRTPSLGRTPGPRSWPNPPPSLAAPRMWPIPPMVWSSASLVASTPCLVEPPPPTSGRALRQPNILESDPKPLFRRTRQTTGGARSLPRNLFPGNGPTQELKSWRTTAARRVTREPTCNLVKSSGTTLGSESHVFGLEGRISLVN